MIGLFMHITILTLWKQKKSKSETAKIVDCDRKTIRRVIKQYQEQQQETVESNKARPTKFDICKDEITN
jgi:hypothetical protein